MKTAEQAASECGNAMCEKYGMTIDHAIPCEEAFLKGVELGRGVESEEVEVMINEIIEQYEDETFLKAEGFDEAIIGIDETTMRLIYSVSKCLEILMRDMSEEDAKEYFNYNVSGSYVGEKTPIWCSDNFAQLRNRTNAYTPY